MRPRPTPSCRRIAKLPLRLALVGLASLAASGCQGVRAPQIVVAPLPAGADIQLEAGDGILVVETLSDSYIEYLRLSSSASRAVRLVKNLPQGHHVHLLVLPAGDYRWSRIALPGTTYKRWSYPMQWDLDSDEQWQVSVEAGQVNYPGMIVLHRSAWRYLSYRVLNRSGGVLASIEERFPGLLTRFTARYGGAGRDDFLEYYRAALVSRGPADEVSDEETALAPDDL